MPIVSIEREFNLSKLIAARNQCNPRPSWFAIFLKAWALVCDRHEVLRRSYLSFPYARLHQHTCNVGHLAVVRRIGEEDVVLGVQIRYPEKKSIADVDDFVRRTRTEPLENFGDFRRLRMICRLPTPLRRFAWWAGLNCYGDMRARVGGTFGVSAIGALGSSSLHVLSPLTTTLSYGVFNPDGSAIVRLFFDHRVLDGVQTAAGMATLDETLNGPILAELRGSAMRLAA
jgi:hypothetical protein